MSDLSERDLSRIRRAATAVELRIRMGRALAAFTSSATAGLAVAAVALGWHKAYGGTMTEGRLKLVLGTAAAGIVLSVVWSALRKLPPRAGSVLLDRHHGLADRLTNALEFAQVPAKERTALMEIAVEDAATHAKGLSPRRAAPVAIPRDTLAVLAVAAGVAAVASLEIRTLRPPQPKELTKKIDALVLPPDDLDLMREAAKEMQRENQSEDMKAALEKFNQLIDDIAHQRLDRAEAFRRMEAIERDFLKSSEEDRKALEAALKKTAEELKKADLAKDVAEALAKKDLKQASKEFKKIAEALRSKKPPSKQELEKLRQAMEKAAKDRKAALAALDEKRASLKEELLAKKEELKKKNEQSDAGKKEKDDEEDLLKKKERELERLDREKEKQERIARALSKLDRALGKAAADLAKELGLSAEDFEQMAEDLSKLEQDELSEKEKEELRQRLEELKELMRQQGQGGKERLKRMMKFGKKARGKGGKGSKSGKGEPGEGSEKGDEDGDGDGDGDGDKDGNGDGNGGDKPGGKGLKLGKMPGGGGGDQPGGMPGGGSGDGPGGDGPGGDGTGPGGKQAGTGHDANVKGNKTDMKHKEYEVNANANDSGQGPSNSQVIVSAAERGFRGAPYKKVFTNYRTHAEEQINKDKIPEGYKFYVQRYFQLIRPRE